jgi:hypothetical protein
MSVDIICTGPVFQQPLKADFHIRYCDGLRKEPSLGPYRVALCRSLLEVTLLRGATVGELKTAIKQQSGLTCITVRRNIAPKTVPTNAQTLEEAGLLTSPEVNVTNQTQVSGVARAAKRVMSGAQVVCRKFGGQIEAAIKEQTSKLEARADRQNEILQSATTQLKADSSKVVEGQQQVIDSNEKLLQIFKVEKVDLDGKSHAELKKIEKELQNRKDLQNFELRAVKLQLQKLKDDKVAEAMQLEEDKAKVQILNTQAAIAQSEQETARARESEAAKLQAVAEFTEKAAGMSPDERLEAAKIASDQLQVLLLEKECYETALRTEENKRMAVEAGLKDTEAKIQLAELAKGRAAARRRTPVNATAEAQPPR